MMLSGADMSLDGDGKSAPMHLQTPPSADTSPAGRGLDDEMQRLANEHLRNLKQVPAAMQTSKDPLAAWFSPLFDRAHELTRAWCRRQALRRT